MFACNPYVIAEIGSNHNGDVDLGIAMIKAARAAGCQAVKFQSFDTRLFVKKIYEDNAFLGDGRDLSDLRTAVQTYSVDREMLSAFAQAAKKEGIDFASSVFEPDQINDLVDLDAAFIKIASMDVDNPYLLEAIGGTKLPVVLSTGMADLSEVSEAVSVLEDAGCSQLAILHCVSIYPAPIESLNLRNIQMLASTFGYPVGFSDHSQGTTAAITACSLGATIIEKHFTTDKSLEGWDHAISADPKEMAALTQGVKDAGAALGSGRRLISADEREKRITMRRSIVSVKRIPAGTRISRDDLTFRRPGSGFSPASLDTVLGRVAERDIDEDVVLTEDMIGTSI